MAGLADQVSVPRGAASRLPPGPGDPAAGAARLPAAAPGGRCGRARRRRVAAGSAGRDGRRGLGRGPGQPGGVGCARGDRHRRLRGLPRAPLTVGDRLAGRGAPGRLGGPAGAGAAARPAAARGRGAGRRARRRGPGRLRRAPERRRRAPGLREVRRAVDRDAGAGRLPVRTADAAPGGPHLRAGVCRRVGVRHRDRSPLRAAPGGGSGGERRHARVLPHRRAPAGRDRAHSSRPGGLAGLGLLRRPAGRRGRHPVEGGPGRRWSA